MKKLNYLNISHILLRSYKSSYFSSLPYSAFKTNLFLDINPKHTKLKLNKFRWRNTVVSLRAPKHFKVGRQHYNKSSRISLYFLKNIKNNWIKSNYNNTYSSINNFINFTPFICNLNQQPPLTITKTVWITLSFKFKFNNLLI